MKRAAILLALIGLVAIPIGIDHLPPLMRIKVARVCNAADVTCVDIYTGAKSIPCTKEPCTIKIWYDQNVYDQ